MKRLKKLMTIMIVMAMFCSAFVTNFNVVKAAEPTITNLAKYCKVEIDSGEKSYYLTNGAINNTYWKVLINSFINCIYKYICDK